VTCALCLSSKTPKIVQTLAPDGRVDLLVKTEDSWTTSPVQYRERRRPDQLFGGFSRKSISSATEKISPTFIRRISTAWTHVVGYSDPQFPQLAGGLGSTFEDTQRVTPRTSGWNVFLLLDHARAGGVFVQSRHKPAEVFEGGSQINQYDQEHLNASPYFGLWANHDPLNVLRLQIHYRYSEDIFRAQDVTIPVLSRRTGRSPGRS